MVLASVERPLSTLHVLRTPKVVGRPALSARVLDDPSPRRPKPSNRSQSAASNRPQSAAVTRFEAIAKSSLVDQQRIMESIARFVAMPKSNEPVVLEECAQLYDDRGRFFLPAAIAQAKRDAMADHTIPQLQALYAPPTPRAPLSSAPRTPRARSGRPNAVSGSEVQSRINTTMAAAMIGYGQLRRVDPANAFAPRSTPPPQRRAMKGARGGAVPEAPRATPADRARRSMEPIPQAQAQHQAPCQSHQAPQHQAQYQSQYQSQYRCQYQYQYINISINISMNQYIKISID